MAGITTTIALLLAVACGRSAPLEELPAELATNLLMVRGTVNGSSPLFLIVDTGASSSVIDRARAEQIGLRLGRPEDASTGGGSIAATHVENVALRLGTVELRDMPMVAIDLTPLRAGLDQRVDGIIGYDLFASYVVELDYRNRVVRLRDPAQRPSASSRTLPIAIREQIPYVTSTLTSVDGRRANAVLELDTGQTGALTLTQAFVEKEGLLGPAQPTLSITTGALLPGQVTARVARMGYVAVGDIHVNAPIANITPSQQDAGVSGDAVGILGSEILRRFTVAIDYSRQQVRVTPNDDLNAPIEFDTTGMSLASVAEPRSFRVRTVIEGSPAAEAGVLAGDVITAIDGRPAGEMTLADIRQQFRRPGAEIRLTLVRDGAERQVAIRTRRLI